MFEASQYLIEKRTWGNRKNKRLQIENKSEIILGYFEPDGINRLLITDTNGTIQAEVERLSGSTLSLAVYGPQHGYRGTVRLTQLGMGGMITIPSLYEIRDSQGILVAKLKASRNDRNFHTMRYLAPNGELVADVYPSSMKGFVQLDIARPGFDPLYVLADVTWSLMKGKHADVY